MSLPALVGALLASGALSVGPEDSTVIVPNGESGYYVYLSTALPLLPTSANRELLLQRWATQAAQLCGAAYSGEATIEVTSDVFVVGRGYLPNANPRFSAVFGEVHCSKPLLAGLTRRSSRPPGRDFVQAGPCRPASA